MLKIDTAPYAELLRQREMLEQQIAAMREAEVAGVVRHLRVLIEEFGLTQEEIFPLAKPKHEKHQGEPKYRDPVSGRTWTGRGRLPDWIKGQDRKKFEI